jgi:hypothetical protein
MKTSTMFKAIAVATTLAAALSASVLAQSAPAAPGMGMGPGAGGMRGMRFDKIQHSRLDPDDGRRTHRQPDQDARRQKL